MIYLLKLLKIKNIKKIINFFCISTVAFPDYRIYIPFVLIFLLNNIHEIIALTNSAEFSKFNIKLTVITLTYIITLFLIGYSIMLTENPFKQMAVIVFQTLFIFFVFSLLSKSEYQFVLDAVIFGFLLNSLIIIIYSLTYHSSDIGYGSLFDPITGDKLNTPHISNSLAIVFSYYIAKFFDEKNKFFIILYVLINIILVISAIVLAGRSFFVISSLSLFLCILFKKSKSFTYLVIFSGTIIFILNIFSDTEFFNYVNFLFNRFENGLESTRTDLYSYGLSNIANYPLGGFTLNSSISNTLWFHNIFLDTASTSGWISLFFLIIFYIFPFFNSGIYYTRPQSIKYTVTFVSLFLVAQQDVIIEGNFKIFITTYAALICLHSTRYIKTPSSNSFTNKLHNINKY